jgi:hypothetical protein
MPTKNPRLSITFQPSFKARLERLSAITGNSQGALAAELLEGCIPAIDRLIKLLEAATAARADVLGKLVSDMEQAQTRVEAQLGLALGEFDTVTSSLTDDAEKVRRRGSRSATRSAAPRVLPTVPTPISNRGVRSTPKHRKAAP